jgi:endonuclease/exonuclease/phosphatase family metal-dependent hydrolase
VEWLAERKTQVDVLLPAIERHGARDATILCGDDDPDSPALLAVKGYRPGLRDSFATCHPDAPGLTWMRQNPYIHHTTERDQRIDYIFCADALTPISSAIVFNDAALLLQRDVRRFDHAVPAVDLFVHIDRRPADRAAVDFSR